VFRQKPQIGLGQPGAGNRQEDRVLGNEVAALEEGALGAGMPASRVRTYESKTALVDSLREELDESAVLLVKGSRGMRMEEVVELLTAEAPASRSAEA